MVKHGMVCYYVLDLPGYHGVRQAIPLHTKTRTLAPPSRAHSNSIDIATPRTLCPHIHTSMSSVIRFRILHWPDMYISSLVDSLRNSSVNFSPLSLSNLIGLAYSQARPLNLATTGDIVTLSWSKLDNDLLNNLTAGFNSHVDLCIRYVITCASPRK